MRIKSDKIQGLISDLEEIISILQAAEAEHSEELEQIHPSFKEGAKNLIHYRTFRSLDLKKLQKRLSTYGLSILASTESHVMATLTNSRHILKSLIQDTEDHFLVKKTSIKSSVKQQKKHTKDLFGYRSKGRRVRIMVTLPIEAAYDYQIVHDLVASGMNTARINCGHYGPNEWVLMIENLNRAKQALRKKCKVFMDLAGPKIRTGVLEEGPKVQKFRPARNEVGEVIEPVRITLVYDRISHTSEGIPVNEGWLKSLKSGDSIDFIDARKKKRKLFIQSIFEDGVVTTCRKTCYIETGTKLKSTSTLEETSVGELLPKDQFILLKKGDHLRLLKKPEPGKQAQFNTKDELIKFAQISCTSPEIFESVNVGEKILFDDGKITGIIKNVTSSELLIKILHTKPNGTKLKADKGINLPETYLNFSGLTKKDKRDLEFVIQHADGINVSFVNSAEGVEELYKELEQLGAKENLGIVLKIENQKAYKNLIEILLSGMRRYPIGVMIARGDLAIETGWENMPRIQNEILRLCDSAYVPTVWATQVLENLAKKGVPSRSELTDVASSLKADCVMLNKGPFILDAIHLLHQILSSMNTYRDKDVRMFEAIEAP